MKLQFKFSIILLVVAGCGSVMKKPISPAFDIRFMPNSKEKISLLTARIGSQVKQEEGKGRQAVPNSLGKPVLLGTKTGKPSNLMLYLIDEGRVLWSVERNVTAKPSLLFDTVIFKEGKEIVGLRMDTGAEKWRLDPKGWEYFGAAQGKDRIFITLGIGGECRKVGMHRGKIMALDAQKGSVLWERVAEGHCLGAPSFFADRVFLPYDMQSISVLDAKDGVEEARLLSLDDNFTFVASYPEGVFYGSKGLYAFDRNSYTGLKKGEYTARIKTNDPVMLTLANTGGDDVTVYRSKGGAPPGFEDKATPLGRWEMGQDRFIEMKTDGAFRVTNKKDELTTLQKKGSIFVGGEGRFSIEGESIKFKVESGTYYEPPLGRLPGEPELFKDSISPVTGITNARDKIRLLWDPKGIGEGGEIAFVGDSIFLIYYRFIFSFDVKSGELRWAYRSALDVEDIAVGPGGVFIADRKGDITCLDPLTGELKGKVPTGRMITAASFNTGDWVPEFPNLKSELVSTREELLEMILDKDNRLVPIRQFALGLLARIEDPEVTRDLLTVYMNKSVPGEIKSIARQRILERESGAAYIIEALKFHYDYIEEIEPPPVGVAAQALVKMKAREGVLPLLQHLLDHETSLEDMREVALAILELGDSTVVPTVSDYLVRYHADSAFKEDLNTLYVLAEIIFKYGGLDGREFLKSLQSDRWTVKALANQIKEIFDRAYQEEVAAKIKAEAAVKKEGEGKKEEASTGRVYKTLTQQHVTGILDRYKAEFAPCIQEYAEKVPTTTQVRLKFIFNNKGKVENLMTLPNDPGLSSCIMAALIKIEWPRISQLKQTAQYVIPVAKPKKETPEWPPQPVPAPLPEVKPPEEAPPPPPGEWLPVPEPLPLPQPAPQPPTEPQPPPLPQPPSEQPPPGIEEYPDVLPEDLPGS